MHLSQSRDSLKGDIKGMIWGFTKIRGTILGVPIVRTIVYWGLYWGPLIFGNYHIGDYYGGCQGDTRSFFSVGITYCEKLSLS